MLKKVTFCLALCFLGFTTMFAQSFYHKIDTIAQQAWADSVFLSLTPEERIGQLFMVAAYSNRDEAHVKHIDSLIAKYNIGGLIFFQGGPERQAQLNNRYQKLSKVPMAIAMDAEWGVGMRLDSVFNFPKQMTMGAIQDSRWVYEMGKEVAHQFELMGMHINFAPVADVNVNPKNPVIGYRSFGESPEWVAKMSTAYMKGLQDHGIMANAKHFPGHGDTQVDSHFDLPVINHDSARLSEIELYPFRHLFRDSLMSIMVAHLQVPSLDNRPNTPTTLSAATITDLLKNEMGFEGLVFTDAMNMKGVAKYYEPGEADVKALQAGNDIILFPVDVAKGIDQVQKAIEKGELNQASLNQRVMKVLKAKYWMGLHQPQQIPAQGLKEKINNDFALSLNRILYQKAMTVVSNKENLIPVTSLKGQRFASLSLGKGEKDLFQEALNRYTKFDHYSSDEVDSTLLASLSGYDQVVVNVQGITNSPKNKHNVNSTEINFIRDLQQRTKVITIASGNAYALQYFQGIDHLICTYEDNEIVQDIVPQIIFGGLKAEGRLPITAGMNYPAGTGHITASAQRLSYGQPLEVGMLRDSLNKIDDMVEAAIAEKAIPGAQVLIARKGKVIFQKNYGYQTYDNEKPITDGTMYDIASVTKVAAITQILMKLYDEEKVNLNHHIGDYLPELKGTNKANLLIKDILIHQAGLKPYIPFWEKLVIQNTEHTDTQNSGPSHNYSTESPFIPALADSVWQWTIDSDLLEKPRKKERYEYLYSDLGYEIIFKLVSSLINEPIETYLQREFYEPLGMHQTVYLPLEKGFYEGIAPSEVDNYFRNTVICGEVNDQNAALMGGIAGHAGLFSNARDLAILMQMNLQLGNYGGQQYFQPWTVPIFTSKQGEDNRRGLGWDKPITGTEDGPTGKLASASTFGHTGFTGAAVWADPQEDFLYIFMCNRTYPDSNNFKLLEDNIRTRIQDLIYQSIIEP